jgi:O-antigen ligase
MGIYVLAFCAAVVVDFSPFNVYKSLQLSDVLFIAGGLVAARPLADDGRLSGATLSRRIRAPLFSVAAAGTAFLVGGGVSTLLAGAPAEGVDTWLHFTLLFFVVVPAVALVVLRDRRVTVALAAGIVLGSTLEAWGYVHQVIEGAPLYGARLTGAYGSDPLFLLVAGIAVIVVQLTGMAVQDGWWRMVRHPLTWFAIASAGLIATALAVSRARSAWLGVLAVFPLAVVALTRRVALAAAIVVALLALGSAAYAAETLPAPVMGRIEELLDRDAPDLAARDDAMRILLAEWRDQPWGLGVGESSRHLPAYLVLGGTGAIHNVPLNTLVEWGPLAALGMLALPFTLTWLWLRSIPRANQVYWHVTWPLVTFWTLYVAGQATPTLHQHVAWIAAGAVVGVSLRQTRAVEENHA